MSNFAVDLWPEIGLEENTVVPVDFLSLFCFFFALSVKRSIGLLVLYCFFFFVIHFSFNIAHLLTISKIPKKDRFDLSEHGIIVSIYERRRWKRNR